MSFYTELQQFRWDEISNVIYSKTATDVERALTKDKPDLHDFQALISPAAKPYLHELVYRSMQITQKRFGKTIQMYIPLYLSNSCSNSCVYCGFNHSNEIKRMILTKDEVLTEAKKIKELGFEHLLLVTGEDSKRCSAAYITEVVSLLRNMFSLISIEVQPLKTDEYKVLSDVGLNTVYVYQETYNQKNYKNYHPSGLKSNFKYRLETPDRIGRAGVHKIGLGCLLGLEDWRVDSFFTALHLQYLEKNYWKTKYSISFPRIRPHTGTFTPNYVTTQKDLVQLICAYRIYNEHVELSMSTREDAKFRDNILKLGVTSFSAGSKTAPGGYAVEQGNTELEQFSVHDDRTPAQIAEMITGQGYEVVWKDWDTCMQNEKILNDTRTERKV